MHRPDGFAHHHIEGVIGAAVVGALVSIAVAFLRRKTDGDLVTPENDRPLSTEAEFTRLTRQRLDAKTPAVAEIRLNQIQAQRERMAQLALLGHVMDLRSEAGNHTGWLVAVVGVNTVAWLGVAFHSSWQRSEAVAELVALAARSDAEFDTVSPPAIEARALAALGLGLLGHSIPVGAWWHALPRLAFTSPATRAEWR